MRAASTHRWISSSAPEQVALELPCANVDELTRALGRLKASGVEPPFIVLNCGGVAAADARKVIAATRSAFAGSRICLALDATSSGNADIDRLRDSHVGLLLDNVDAGTALSRVAAQSVEAIRFESAFALRATRDLRTNCVLSALLGLARDLGLCTLGPRIQSSSELLGGHLEFDFIPERRKEARRSARASDASVARPGDQVGVRSAVH